MPCGLGARNTLRLEGKLPLYGHEISETINVWEAGLDRFLKMEKGEFIGRDALEKAKADWHRTRRWSDWSRSTAAFRAMDTRCSISSGKEIGYVTSGSYAPFLKKNIALAYVPVRVVGDGYRSRSGNPRASR